MKDFTERRYCSSEELTSDVTFACMRRNNKVEKKDIVVLKNTSHQAFLTCEPGGCEE